MSYLELLRDELTEILRDLEYYRTSNAEKQAKLDRIYRSHDHVFSGGRFIGEQICSICETRRVYGIK